MLTQCPGCQTVFRVTSTILRAAHGQVRCGRCNTQFDAIEQLQDGEDTSPGNGNGDAVNHQETGSSSHDYDAAALSHEEIVLEGNRIEISGIYRHMASDEAQDNPAHSRTVIEEFNLDPEEWAPPVDHLDNAAPPTDDDAETELEDVEQELTATSLADAIASLDTAALTERLAKGGTDQIANTTISRRLNHRDATSASADESAATNAETNPLQEQPAPEIPATATHAQLTKSLPPLDLADEPFESAPRQRRWPWALASAALSLLLLAQALHHSRAALARHPSFGPQLSRLYAAIGQPLTPQWQLQAYSIKQWGIVSDPQEPGTLRVRASVTNGAGFAQPYPLLQLSLEDRFGGKVGTRDFKPEEYLGSNAQATRLLAAGEAANIDLAIVDPGQDAVGFQFDTCLQLNNGLQCTHDLPLQQP
ncbi:MAG: DUF3426 domain-containing protein [Steroidobacteraceae bacterium]